MNVARIQTKAESGDITGAHEALDALLEMGPRNLEGLKLRARLHGLAGRFGEEAQAWERIAEISRDDEDLLDYLVRRQVEDREHFYFTDALPGGGKRFLAFPRRMVAAATMGLVGCLVFLMLARLGQRFTIFTHPVVMLASFFGMVLAPWLAIMWTYARSIRHIVVAMDGVEIATRFKLHKLPRNEIDKVFMAYDDRKNTWKLSMIILSKELTLPSIEIDFNESSTPIRARLYFMKEISRYYGEPQYVAKADLASLLNERKLIRA